MTLRDQILEAIDSPGQLEALYRRGPGEFARVFPEAAPGFRDSRSLAPEAVLRTTAVTEPPCRAGRESSRLLSPHGDRVPLRSSHLRKEHIYSARKVDRELSSRLYLVEHYRGIRVPARIWLQISPNLLATETRRLSASVALWFGVQALACSGTVQPEGLTPNLRLSRQGE